MNSIFVTNAEYIQGFKVKISFSDNTTKTIDFEPFLKEKPHPQWDKYSQLSNFKKFKIDNGNLVWGKNWDLIFPVNNLYIGNLYEPCS